uniref:Uncharacterized protein n=1 Tax=Trichogramma kaykai TaxID=54128 RepID=A0ABD2VWE2_9HYME
MESSDILNCAIRVKEEPSDESPDSKNFPLLPFPPENSLLCRCLGSLPLYKSAMSRSYIPTLCSILSDFFE